MQDTRAQEAESGGEGDSARDRVRYRKGDTGAFPICRKLRHGLRNRYFGRLSHPPDSPLGNRQNPDRDENPH